MSEELKSSNDTDTTEIRTYDFKRPDKFTKEQLGMITAINEQFARLSTTSLSTRLKTNAFVTINSVGQITFGEYLKNTAENTTLAMLNLEPLGNAVLGIDPALAFFIIEKLYGSGIDDFTPENRSITELEQHLLNDIITALISNITTSWQYLAKIKPSVSYLETNPNVVQSINPNEMVISIVFKVETDNTESFMTFNIPYLTIESVLPRLSVKYFYSKMETSNKGKDDQYNHDKIFSLIEDSKAGLSITMNTGIIPLIRIDSITEGEEIPLCNINDLFAVNINGQKVMEGNLGHRNNKWSVRIRKFANE